MARRPRRASRKDFVYRTTYLYEADMVANELQDAGIAFYRAEESPMGVQWAMPLSPAWEPGTSFLVIVPGPHATAARRLVRRLPVSQDEYPGVWPAAMDEETKDFWRSWAWIGLFALGAGLIFSLLAILRQL